MRRFVLFAAMATLAFGSLSPGPAAGLVTQARTLPALDAEGRTLPLTIDQLDPDERASFSRLSPDSADARRFLYTRGFLRFCRLVLDEQLAPLDLPRLPIRDNWDRQFLSVDEATNILDVALGMKFYERMQEARGVAGSQPAPAQPPASIPN